VSGEATGEGCVVGGRRSRPGKGSANHGSHGSAGTETETSVPALFIREIGEIRGQDRCGFRGGVEALGAPCGSAGGKRSGLGRKWFTRRRGCIGGWGRDEWGGFGQDERDGQDGEGRVFNNDGSDGSKGEESLWAFLSWLSWL
jgi:hypothetical protein